LSQPNLLFIFADQLRYSAVGFNGNRVVQTPVLDQMAREGRVFDHCLSSCPICSPYRGQLLTGRYSHANGVMDNEYQLFPGQPTLATALNDAGYRTAYIAKWHLGYPPYTPEKRYGFHDFIGYNNGHLYYDISYWHNEEGPFPMVDYAPFVETQLTIDYMREHRQQRPDQPFAIVLGWGPPHWSPLNNKRDYGEYPQEYDIYDPEEVDLPGNVPVQLVDFERKELADYYAMVTTLDVCMGRLLDELDRLGIGDNTIVVFTSDHGDHLGAHGMGKPYDAWMHHTLRGSKATPFEDSVHVPFVVRYPGKTPGNTRSDTLLSSVDLMPTLVSLCGGKIPEGVQGSDLSHAILGEPGEEPDSVYLQILGPGWPTRTKWIGLWRGLRDHRYTYARWKDREGMRVLYDRQTDPLEMRNVVDDPAYADIAAAMEARLQLWIAETDDPFEAGRRLPVTDMLDLGQRFTNEDWYDQAPKGYVEALLRKSSE